MPFRVFVGGTKGVTPGSMPERWKVILVDDQVLIREALALLLESRAHATVIGQVADALEALELLNRLSCHLLISGLGLNGRDGTGHLHGLKSRHPELAILSLTEARDESSVVDALQAGANGCIPRSATAEEFLEAVRLVASGNSYLHPSVAQPVIARLRLGNSRPETERHLLTPRELDILTLLSRGNNNGEIAAQLHLSLSTVKSHLRTAYRKLGAIDRTQAVLRALKLRLIPDSTTTEAD